MRLFVNKPSLVRILLLWLSMLLVLGCVRSPCRGWCGPVVSDDGILYVGSVKGKILALDLDGNPRGEFSLESEKPVGSLLACSGQVSRAMSIYTTPAPWEGWLYVGGYDGNLYAFDIESGAYKKFPTGGAIVGSPVVSLDTVFIGSSNGKLYALYLDLRQSPRWIFETGDKIWSTPEVVGNVVYIGSFDRNLYAIDIDTGEEMWHFEAQGGILSTPLVANGMVYIGSCDYNFYAIDAATGEKKWRFEAGNWFWTKALLYNNEIWVGCLDHKLYALDINDGHKIWEFETGGPIRTPPVLVDGLIIIGSQDGNIYAIDPEKKAGRELRSLGAPILAPLYSDPQKGVVYIHAQNDRHVLYAVEVKTGDYLWQCETG